MTTLKKGKNSDHLLQANRSLVLQILAREPICTRVQIAEETGLQQASITKIISELMESGLVQEIGHVEGRKGRRSIGLQLNSDRVKLLGVKLSKDMFQVGLFTLTGVMLDKHSEKTDIQSGAPAIVHRMRKVIDRYLDEHSDIFAIGMAVPGPFNRNEGRIVLMADHPGWNEISLREEFEQHYDIPVFIEHDANAGALAEWTIGRLGLSGGTLVHFLASEGVGAGVIEDGHLLLGSRGIAGEIGHMSIDLNGEPCPCGSRGCLRLYCSSLALAGRAAQGAAEHPDSALSRMEHITADDVFDAADAGDAYALELVREAGFYIGCGLVNAVHIYDANRIVISDIMIRGGQVMLDRVRSTLRSRLLPDLYEGLSVTYSQFEYDTILYGAAAVASDQLLKNYSLISRRLVPAARRDASTQEPEGLG